MAAPWVPLRCPRCGTAFAAPPPVTTAAAWVACPSCRTTFPVLAPRDPPPLFAWEAYPGLYPALPEPRVPGPALRRFTAATLLATTILLAAVGAFLFWGGVASFGSGEFALSGTVVDTGGAPVGGALVRIHSEAGYDRTQLTGPTGAFLFRGIPAGSAVLNVTATGYQTMTVEVFFSDPYQATGSGPDGLTITLAGGAAYPAGVMPESAFPDLESFVASLWSATVLLGMAASLGLAGTVAARRGRRPVLPATAGAGAMVAPFALVLLGTTAAFPFLDWIVTAITALGVVGLTLAASTLLSRGAPADNL